MQSTEREKDLLKELQLIRQSLEVIALSLAKQNEMNSVELARMRAKLTGTGQGGAGSFVYVAPEDQAELERALREMKEQDERK